MSDYILMSYFCGMIVNNIHNYFVRSLERYVGDVTAVNYACQATHTNVITLYTKNVNEYK